jgi:hypothetical protein
VIAILSQQFLLVNNIMLIIERNYMPISVRIRLSHTNEKLDNKTNNKIR